MLRGLLYQLNNFSEPASKFVAGALYQYVYDQGGIARWVLNIFPEWRENEEDVEEAVSRLGIAFQLGRNLGDGAAIVTGLAEIVGGGTAAGGGGALCFSGIGCIGGAPAVAFGLAVGAHGVSVVSEALMNIAERLGLVFASTTTTGDGDYYSDAEVLDEKNVDNGLVGGSTEPWTGSGNPPKWGNPKSKKAYGHSVLDHGMKNKPRDMQNRANSKGKNSQWYDDTGIVEAEKAAPKYKGNFLLNFRRPIGRVFYKGQDKPVEGVTRAFVERKFDGTIKTTYPVDNDFILTDKLGR